MTEQTNREAILFLYLPTGGGHISAARALSEEIKKTSHAENTDLHMLDPLEKSPGFIRSLVEDGYTTISVQFPFIWPMVYQISSYGPVMAVQTMAMSIVTRSYLASYIRKHKITRIVILHFLLIRPVREALALLGRDDISVMTVVLDPFTIHPLWAFRAKGPVCVFSQESKNRLHRRLKLYGFPGSPERRGRPDIRVVPPLIRSDFLTPLSPETNHKNRLAQGFNPHRKLILLAGGGDGLPGGEALLEEFCLQARLQGKTDIQIAMICGKNTVQRSRALAISEDYPEIRIEIYGFTKMMYEFMNMCDLVIGKGGPATVFEALCLGKPLFISSYFYGQEHGNVDFVVRNRLGYYDANPRRMALTALDWLEHSHSPSANPQARWIKKTMLTRSGARDIVQVLFALPRKSYAPMGVQSPDTII